MTTDSSDKIDHHLEFIKQIVVEAYIEEVEKQGAAMLFTNDFREAAKEGAKIYDYRIDVEIPMKITNSENAEMMVTLKKRQDNKQDVDL